MQFYEAHQLMPVSADEVMPRVPSVKTFFVPFILNFFIEYIIMLMKGKNERTEALKMSNKDNRFKVVYKDGSQLKEEGYRQILVDRETGVNYLAWKSGYAGGITPLLDSAGNVIVTVTE